MRTTPPHLPRRVTDLAALLVALLLVASACGTGPEALASAEPGANTSAIPSADPDAPIALVMSEGGLAGVPVGTSEPRWVEPDAVAAPDGSAVFTVRPAPDAEDGRFELVEIDRHTGVALTGVGTSVESWTADLDWPSDLQVAAVAPGGSRVALTAPSGADTLVRDVVLTKSAYPDDDVYYGGWGGQIFEGTVEPEAYSADRTQLFAARIYPDRYHVHVLDLATGEQWPTLGPDKEPPEDMYGSVVQAVLSPDRTQLATLYRDTVSPDHTAFVHLLSLVDGSTVCIDLHAPFGTGAPGTDAIEWQADGTVEVGHTAQDPAQSMSAAFVPADIWAGPPQEHYHAEDQPDPSPVTVPAGVAATPGFVRFVALAT